MLSFWVISGSVLVLAECFLPGLVAVFLGIGSLTVALLLWMGVVTTIPAQVLTWFIASLVYIFTLRLLVIRLYPSDTQTKNIDEDVEAYGKIVEVIEPISENEPGRIAFGDTTWKAQGVYGDAFLKGEKVRISARDNITWLVEKL